MSAEAAFDDLTNDLATAERLEQKQPILVWSSEYRRRVNKLKKTLVWAGPKCEPALVARANAIVKRFEYDEFPPFAAAENAKRVTSLELAARAKAEADIEEREIRRLGVKHIEDMFASALFHLRMTASIVGADIVDAAIAAAGTLKMTTPCPASSHRKSNARTLADACELYRTTAAFEPAHPADKAALEDVRTAIVALDEAERGSALVKMYAPHIVDMHTLTYHCANVAMIILHRGGGGGSGLADARNSIAAAMEKLAATPEFMHEHTAPVLRVAALVYQKAA